jgi:hypothetical protein
MKSLTLCSVLIVLSNLTLPANAQTTTVPLGTVTLPPAAVAITPITVILTITVNGVPMQANVTLSGAVGPAQTGGYQLALTPTPGPLPLTAATHTELHDTQPWLFIGGFTPLDLNDTPASIKTGNRVLISGHNFGAQDASCRVEVNGQPAPIVSWLDTAIVAQVPPCTNGSNPASVMVWHGKDNYDLCMAPFKVAGS